MTRLCVALAAAITIQAAPLPAPGPRDAVAAILDAFSRYDVVGLNAAHGDRTQDVGALPRRGSDPTLSTVADRAEARQFAPGAECVGKYAESPGGTASAEIDFRGGHLALRLGSSSEWTRLDPTVDRFHYRAVDGDAVEMSCEVSGLEATAITVTSRGTRRPLVTWRPISRQPTP